MTVGTIVAVVGGIVAAAWILAPLFRPEGAPSERDRSRDSDRADWMSRKEMILGSLRDLEDDHDTAKIADEDYEALKARLESEAVEVFRKLDDLEKAAEVRTRPAIVGRDQPS